MSGPAPAPPAGVPAAGGDGAGLVGTVLAGRYRILEKLGEGAMGAVYLGEHLHIGRRDAIKVLRPSLASDAEAVARFGRGARSVSRIVHPGVCAVYDFAETGDGRRFLAMEYVPGCTLADLIREAGRLPVARAVEIARQAAGALQAAHEAGIVHRDLKPANVMIAPGRGGADLVKVVDFDIAKGVAGHEAEPGGAGEAHEPTLPGFVVGTPEYMAPEQLLDQPLDGRSDVYSLALVLFRMLTGGLPYRAAQVQDVLVQRLTAPPLRLDEVLPGIDAPPALQAALDRALQRRPDDRFPSAAAFADAITAAVAAPAPGPLTAGLGVLSHDSAVLPATVVTASAPVSSPGTEGGERRRAALALGGVAAAAVLAWGGAHAFGPRGDRAAQTGSTAAAADTRAVIVDTHAVARDTTATRQGEGGMRAVPEVRTGGGGGDTVAGGASEVRRDTQAPGRESGNTTVVAHEPEREAEAAAAARAAHARADRLMDELAGASSPGELRRIRGRAEALWGSAAARAEDRAAAAYVAGDASSQLGDAAECVRWMERALRLRPAFSGARTLLAACRSLQP